MERSEYKNIDDKFIREAEAIADEHAGFTDGCRVLFLIQRASDGGHANNSKLRAYISRDAHEWIEACGKLLWEAAQYPELPLRIYQSLNARNVEKGIMHFKHAMLDADYYDDSHRIGFYLDVRNRIVSALMKPPSAATSLFFGTVIHGTNWYSNLFGLNSNDTPTSFMSTRRSRAFISSRVRSILTLCSRRRT